MLSTGRVSGLLLPLFSLRSRTDFGIGDFGALDGLFAWMRHAEQRMLMLLPLLPTAPNDSSPYSTQCAFGLNPLFIDLAQQEDFQEAGGEAGLPPEWQATLREVRSAPIVRYGQVIPLKRAALRKAFAHFESVHLAAKSARAQAFTAYAQEQAPWLDDYALFCALSAEQSHRGWWDWPQELAQRAPEALAAARARLRSEVQLHQWMQWVAETQWQKVRQQAAAQRVLLCGDEPFIIGQDSSDVWAHPDILRRDARLGVPPDDFSATGQDWGLPYFDFARMEAHDYQWLRFRARKSAAYYDLRRVDHAVGYFRQWIRDAQSPTGRFVPPDEAAWRRLGERHFRLLSEEAGIVAEDLGVIPPFVREMLSQLGVPGYRVMRWEREDGHYRHPRDYPARSLATTGTHDTETLRAWWENAADWERDACARVYSELHGLPTREGFTPQIHQALLAAAENSTSELCILPWQDVLGTHDRVNLPGSTVEANWAYRIAEPVEELLAQPRTREAAEWLARLTREGRRAA